MLRTLFTIPGVDFGLPGFGVMLALAVYLATWLTAKRFGRLGEDPEVVWRLSMWYLVGGLVGARAFYVIQYHDQFKSIWDVFNITKGGMVFYGSAIGAFSATAYFCWKEKTPVWKLLDAMAPSLPLGIAIGRIGCFLNGCCYGGVCLGASYAVTFPADSPPYLQHMSEGWRTGVWLAIEGEQVTVAYVSPALAAVLPGLRPGSTIVGINGAQVSTLADARHKLATATGGIELETADGQVLRWRSPPPPRSVPVHPAQVYAAIDAALLALVLWLYFPYRRRRGEIFAILLIVHPVSRFLLEMIRVDEPGQLGTSLSISQWISMLIVLLGIALLAYVETLPGLVPHPKIS